MNGTFLPQLWSDEVIRKFVDKSILKALMEKQVIYWDFIPLDERGTMVVAHRPPARNWEKLQACIFS